MCKVFVGTKIIDNYCLNFFYMYLRAVFKKF